MNRKTLAALELEARCAISRGEAPCLIGDHVTQLMVLARAYLDTHVPAVDRELRETPAIACPACARPEGGFPEEHTAECRAQEAKDTGAARETPAQDPRTSGKRCGECGVGWVPSPGRRDY